MIKNSVISLLLCSSVGYVYSMESIVSNIRERHQQVALGCLALIITGFTIKKVCSYYVQKEGFAPQEPQLSQNIQLKYENIKVRLNDLKMDINCAAKSLDLLEKDRLALLQEIIPDVLLEHKTEKEIHERIMRKLYPENKLHPAYASLALAVGDVNQALLDLKKRQKGQQDLKVKGYVL